MNRPTGDIDHLVLGGGSAGAVMATRLSEDPRCRVVLIEAGPDLAATGLPEKASDVAMRTVFEPGYYWDSIVVHHPAGPPGANRVRMTPSLTPKVVGGGSFVNGMQATRGVRGDYEEWSELGVTGWGADDLLPYFNKVETDLDFDGPAHGSAGPIHIQRIPDDRWSAMSRATRDVLASRGLRAIADVNDGLTMTGFGAVPMNIGPDGRMSTANAYLTPEIRRRDNLRIVADTRALKIEFVGARAVGARCQDTGGEFSIHSDNVIVCCGALLSPALLQRSGIGPGSLLRQAGVGVVADRPGVGRNLNHHAAISLNMHLRSRGRIRGVEAAPCPMVVRYSSGEASSPEADLYLYVWERATPALSRRQDRLGRQLGNLMLQMNKCRSVGAVTIRPEDPAGHPEVLTNLLGDERDSRRFVAAVRDLISLSKAAPLAGLVNERLLMRFTPFTRKTMEDTPEGWLLNQLGAIALGGPSILRKAILRRVATVVDDLSDDALAAAVHASVSTSHPAGTCRLGDPSDRQAVVDPRGRVVGAEGLRVVDASILPTLPRGGPNLPTMMAAEKVADMMKEDRRGGA